VEVTEFLGRDRYARGERARAGHRNGHAELTVKSTAGPITLARPKLAMRCVKRRLGPVSGHRGVAAQRVGAGPTTGQARTA
jgi:hypothetical protein